MADNSKVYRTKLGIVAYEPDKDNVNGREVIRLVINTTDPPQRDGRATQAHLTIWPNHRPAADAIKQGDGLLVQGEYRPNTTDDGRTFHNISVSQLVHMPAIPRKESGSTGSQQGGAAPVGAEPDDGIPF